MGMKWYAVLVKATDDEVCNIAVAAQQLVPSLKSQIDASVISLRSPAVSSPWIELQMCHFQNRRPECNTAPSCVREAFTGAVFQSDLGAEILGTIAHEPHVALAILASRLCGKAMFVVSSDSLCCSGYLRFQNGTFVSGDIYGWGGSETLWNLSAEQFRCEEIELTGPDGYDYHKPIVDGLTHSIGPGTAELFLSPNGGGFNGACVRYHIIAKRQPISPVIGKLDDPNQPIAEPTADTQFSPERGAAGGRRPWWKFW